MVILPAVFRTWYVQGARQPCTESGRSLHTTKISLSLFYHAFPFDEHRQDTGNNSAARTSGTNSRRGVTCAASWVCFGQRPQGSHGASSAERGSGAGFLGAQLPGLKTVSFASTPCTHCARTHRLSFRRRRGPQAWRGDNRAFFFARVVFCALAFANDSLLSASIIMDKDQRASRKHWTHTTPSAPPLLRHRSTHLHADRLCLCEASPDSTLAPPCIESPRFTHMIEEEKEKKHGLVAARQAAYIIHKGPDRMTLSTHTHTHSDSQHGRSGQANRGEAEAPTASAAAAPCDVAIPHGFRRARTWGPSLCPAVVVVARPVKTKGTRHRLASFGVP